MRVDSRNSESGLLRLGAAWVLVFGAEPADEAGGFFFGALGVEGYETFENFGIGQGCGPAVGGEDGGVEIVVELAEDGNETMS